MPLLVLTALGFLPLFFGASVCVLVGVFIEVSAGVCFFVMLLEGEGRDVE